MFGRTWKTRLFGATLAAAMLASPVAIPDLDAAQRRQSPRKYEEPAYARGYEDGHARGLSDGRNRERYDPAGSREYRDAEEGYSTTYGSRDAYRNNYRAGYRQGYEDGYREGTR